MRTTVLFRAAALLTLSALAVSTAAFAQEPKRAHARHHAWEERLQQRLGLTDQQVQAIREIRTRNAEARKQHWQQMRAAQTELRRLVLIEADQASIDAKQAEVQQLAAAGVEQRVKMLQAITPVLTPEQREAFAKLGEGRGHFHKRAPDRS
ncbi:MAG TPA: Spy/CpxP family protein refolding chaperone [Methylomirabilota bacterium]|jgi:Spy/CpxP family protein refolding chaperone|nr:Spy/CpxP family protein refolding chaperone [Methylomirabilota bacterium]